MSLSEMKAEIKRLTPGERAELERYLATLQLEDSTDWQEKAFEGLRQARRGELAMRDLDDLRSLHERLADEGR